MRVDYIRRSPTGHRIGEGHHRARVPDLDVRVMRELRIPHDGSKPWTYAALAEKFDCSISTVRDICKFWTRTDV